MKIKESISTLALLEAVRVGYKVDEEGNVFYKKRKHNLSTNTTTKYYYISRRILIDGKSVSKQVSVHRLVAHQRYGEEIFKKGVHVRHLNGNKKDNSKDNILIGTASENNMDKPSDVRMKMALRATSFVKKHNHEEIIKLHIEGLSYKQIAEKLNIKSKGTISFIIKKSIEAKK
mgnify:FL=1